MTDEGKDQEPRRRRGRRLLFRLALWSAALAVVCALLLGAGVYHLFLNRTMWANRLLEEVAPPFVIRVEGIDFRGLGLEGIAVSGVEVLPGKGAPPMLRAESIEVDYTFRGIDDWSIDSIVVVDPVVSAGDEALEAWASFRDARSGAGGEKKGAGTGLRDIVIGSVKVTGGRLESELSSLPRVSLGFELEAYEVNATGDGAVSPEPVRVLLRDLEVRERESADSPILALPKLEVKVLPEAGFSGGTFEAFSVDGLKVRITPAALAALGLGGNSDEKKEEEAEPVAAKRGEGGWILKGISLADGRFSMSGFDGAQEGPLLPDVSLGFGGEFADLAIAGGKVKSAAAQRLRLEDILVVGGAPGSGEEGQVLRLGALAAEVIPDAFFGEGIVEKLHLEEPQVDLSPASLARFMEKDDDGGAAAAGQKDEGKESTGEGKVYRVRDFAVNEGRFSVDPEIAGQSIPVTGGGFEIGMREGAADVDDAFYRAVVTGVNLKNPKLERESLLRLDSVEIDFSAKGLQGGKKIDAINLQGLRVSIDDALQELADKKEGETAGQPEKKGSGSRFAGWTLGALNVDEGRIKVSDLLPDIPPIFFDVKIAEKDLVLGDDRSETGETKRRVELSRVEIPSPRNSFVKVADLRNIFVEFTLKGLLNREIDLIHIADPRVFVGEHLFWYVEYSRKFNDERQAAKEKAAAEQGVEAADDAGWKVKRIVAQNGKLLLAPKGYPIAGIQPFPFNVETDLESGEIDLELKIKDGTYTLSKLGVELNLVGLQGSAIFNVPLRQEDNNLWQYFYVDRVEFKKYEAENLELKITYYEGGISALFGGEAYSGYVNGGVNVYIGEKYAWDAWVSATDVDLGPLTELAVPDTFVMDATVSGNVVAGGVELELGLADANLAELSPGHFQITKLDELLNDLPPEWSELKKAAVAIGVKRLRDFQFDEGGLGFGYQDSSVELMKKDLNVSPYFEGIDFPDDMPAGFLNLSLKGEEGLRSIEIDYLDDSGRDKEKKANKAPLSASNP